MKTKEIECSLIEFTKVPTKTRTFSKEFAENLALSIKHEGLIHPIAIRPNPEAPGRYLGIAGLHRYYAVSKILKQPTISAMLIEDISADEASLLSTCENLWRNPLSKAQVSLALKQWHAAYRAKIDSKRAEIFHSGKNAAATSALLGDSSAAAPKEDEVKKKEDSIEGAFDEMVASATGQSATTVRRVKSIAKAFTEEQLTIFDKAGTRQADMTTVARVKDEKQRAEIVNLITAGVAVQSAIEQVAGENAPKKYNNNKAAAEVAAAKDATKQQLAPDLTDEEWLAQSCGEKAGMLADPTRFNRDALLFRKISEIRRSFRVGVKRELAASKADAGQAGTGPFYNLVNRVISVSHPKDWLICPNCIGRGTSQSSGADTVRCPKCYGACYLLATETYV